jgi:hypothetical protein
MYGGANTPNFLHVASGKSTCAPFFKERRMKLWNPLDSTGNSGTWGTRPISPGFDRRLTKRFGFLASHISRKTSEIWAPKIFGRWRVQEGGSSGRWEFRKVESARRSEVLE